MTKLTNQQYPNISIDTHYLLQQTRQPINIHYYISRPTRVPPNIKSQEMRKIFQIERPFIIRINACTVSLASHNSRSSSIAISPAACSRPIPRPQIHRADVDFCWRSSDVRCPDQVGRNTLYWNCSDCRFRPWPTFRHPCPAWMIACAFGSFGLAWHCFLCFLCCYEMIWSQITLAHRCKKREHTIHVIIMPLIFRDPHQVPNIIPRSVT